MGGPPSSVTLTGPRVVLRPFRPEDAADVAAACRDPDIPRYTLMPESLTEDGAREWIARRTAAWAHGLCSFAVTVGSDHRCVGQAGVGLVAELRRAEAFYWLEPASRGRGLATEALDVVTRWAFAEHGVRRAHLVTHLDNLSSQRVAQRCGYQREGVLRAWEPIKDGQPDVVMWSRLATDEPPSLGPR